MKDFLEKRIFSMKWLFAIIVISFFIETFNHPSDVNAFLSKFISDTVPIEVINRVLTGSGVGIVIWFIIRKLINMQNGENDFFTIYESPVIVDIFIWFFLFKFTTSIIISSLNNEHIINCLISGWYPFYIPLLLLSLLSLIIGLHLEKKK